MKKTYVYFILYLLSFFNSVYSLPKRQEPIGAIGGSVTLSIEGRFTCTSGFPVKGGDLGDTDTGLLLAGHCTANNAVGDQVFVENNDGSLGSLIGRIFKVSYGNGNDFALIKLDQGWFGYPTLIGPGKDGQPAILPIITATSPEEGSQVCLTGATSSSVCGVLIEADGEGSMYVLNKWNNSEFILLEGLNVIDTGKSRTTFGDSGAGVFVTKRAPVGSAILASPVGIYVGFVNDVVEHKESYYYPISTVLEAFGGLELITQKIL
ncbi:9762_t:CDS:1 [Diversispora eburnea]|uniref:9762_t:CDS:1 n=1 Tax=Diversispora eburnea TaxID=1213867 RepID=A0A9N8WA55_9GLOM|nr:9762_t:CDS:1 [Diversispora eburnea]